MPYLYLAYTVLIIIVSFYFKKKLFLSSYTGDNHQLFTNYKNVPLLGGLFLIIPILLINYDNAFYFLSISLIFLIGFFSDRKILISPKKRFLFQIALIFFSVFFLKLEILSSRINYFDYLLQFNIFNVFFTSFCLLILLNGSNFIDGVNIQCSGYYFAIICALLLLPKSLFNLDLYNQLLIIFAFLLVFIFFNFFDQCYLGDSGSYLVSFLVGTLLIKVINENPISPYFIALLLWYPAFENLFSIIRRLVFNKKSIDNADNQHLHHLLYRSFKNKSNLFKKNITGVMINLYNFIIFLIGINYLYDSYVQVILILISIIFYSLTYKILKNNLSNEIR